MIGINSTWHAEKKTLLLLLFLSYVFMVLFYCDLLLSPNKYLFAASGDGIKNYFTFAYHLKHDQNALNFSGMNYPYGEHLFYTDCHPLLALLLKPFSRLTDFFSNHAVGIINLCMLLSIWLSFFVNYILLRVHKVKSLFALLWCLGMTLLAPQVFRMTGHYALSYSVAIPLSWILLVYHNSSQNKRLPRILLFCNLFFWLLIHAYLGVMIFAFSSLFALFHFAFSKNKKDVLHPFVKLALALCLPIALFFIGVKASDQHAGRTTNPLGITLYNAEADDVFLPNHEPLKPLIETISGQQIKQQWEAWAYIGLVNDLVLLCLLGLVLMALFKNERARILLNTIFTRPFIAAFLSALLLLLFAMGIPYRQAPALLDLVPIIKQFRSSGRFDWPFYFVMMVIGASVFQALWDFGNRKKAITTVFVLAALMNIVEGLPAHLDINTNIRDNRNTFNAKYLSADMQELISQINPKDYQAIIALPFYHQGSENFSRPVTEPILTNSIMLSYHTGLPLVNANLTRLSIQESKNCIALIGPSKYKKDIEQDLVDTRPFLLVVSPFGLNRYEQDLIGKAQLLIQKKVFACYVLNKKSLFDRNQKVSFGQTYVYGTDTQKVNRPYDLIYQNSFENTSASHSYTGKGAYAGPKRGQHIIAEIASGIFQKGETYAFSIWMYNDQQDQLNDWFRLVVEERDAFNHVVQETTVFPEQSGCIDGAWSLVEGSFKMLDNKNTLFIITKGKEASKNTIYADELLILSNKDNTENTN